MDLLKFQENCRSIQPWELLKPILVEYLPEMIDANTRQLRRGELNDGDLLEPYRSAIYADFKDALASYKAPSGIPDLYVTGEFQEGFFAEVDDQGITFDSKDGKTSELERKYSSDIFGVQPEEWSRILSDQIIPKYIEVIKNAMLKN